MGVSKVVLIDPNTQTPEVLMDVTGDDTSAGVLLAGNVGTRNDGEKVTGTIPEKTSSDLTVSGATVTAPAGHYATAASKSVASGTAGTPTATKGSVSNHSVNVTPSVTNTTGYISGGTKTGTPVSVSASELVSGTKSIAANGTGIDVTNYASVDVDVPPTPLQTKSVTPTESAQTVTPDSGYALSQVNVGAIDSEYVGSAIDRRDSTDLSLNVDVSGVTVTAPAGYYDETASESIPEGSVSNPDITVASDGTITVTQTRSAGYIRGGSATYRQPLSTQAAATITPSETAQTAVVAGKYTTGDVTVDAIPSDYVGSAIDQRDSSDLTASGATVTVPAGYYEEAASKAVANGSATAPASISGTSATVTAGTNTLTLSKTVSVTPSVTAGYISAGTAGNSSVSLTASVTTKAAATITPGTSNQTIAAGTYLTGAQTIAGSANLVAGNIKSGVNIFGKVGTFAGDATVYKDAWTSRGSLEKNTASLSLSQWRMRGAATSVGDYALFAGGSPPNSSSGSSTVDVISKNLTHSTLASTALASSSVGLAAATVGNYAVFGGGTSTAVTAYNSTLTRTICTSLSSYRESLAATSIGNYVLFGGGIYTYYSDLYSTVETYNTSLTKGTATALSKARHRLSAAHIGNYALFAGGETSSNGGFVNTVDAYNTSLTRSAPTALSVTKSRAAATSVGNYALFGGGYNGSVSAVVDAYNTSLTRSVPTALSSARYDFAATSTIGYALFGGGQNTSAVVDAYNTSLTRSTPTAFSTARYYHSATSIGDIALFGLGYMPSQDSMGVEIYDVPYILTTTVPANYTYMFSDDTPVTVSTATSITKNSITPISGIVCKAATTKTGQVT